MKKNRGVVLVVVFALACAGCSSMKKIDAQQFMSRAQLRTGQMYSDQYIGCSMDRAYLEHRGSHVEVYWTWLNDLPTNIVQQLKAGTSPWGALRPGGPENAANNTSDGIRQPADGSPKMRRNVIYRGE